MHNKWKVENRFEQWPFPQVGMVFEERFAVETIKVEFLRHGKSLK